MRTILEGGDPTDGDDGRERAFVHPALVTLAYRGAPEGFASFRAGDGWRTPVESLVQVGDLLDRGVSLAEGEQAWHGSPPLLWDESCARFFARLAAALLAPAPGRFPGEGIFQGPIAAALAHVGRISYLCRLAAAPVRGEDFLEADIAAGRLGAEQAPPRRELN